MTGTGELICLTGTTLIDNIIPMRLDFNNPLHFLTFVAWSRLHTPTETLYISTRQAPEERQLVSGLRLTVLHYPNERIGVPNLLTLYGSSDTTRRVPFTPTHFRISRIPYDLLNNQELSQHDNSVTRTLILRFRQPSARRRYVLTWDFTNLHNVDWFFVSEVQLCVDDQPPLELGEIIFRSPMDNMPVAVQPNSADLGSRFFRLTCTVSNEGFFDWRWNRNKAELPNDEKTVILSADGTRTSVLIINEFNFGDSGGYICIASHRSDNSLFGTREYDIQFPRKITIIMQI